MVKFREGVGVSSRLEVMHSTKPSQQRMADQSRYGNLERDTEQVDIFFEPPSAHVHEVVWRLIASAKSDLVCLVHAISAS